MFEDNLRDVSALFDLGECQLHAGAPLIQQNRQISVIQSGRQLVQGVTAHFQQILKG